MRKKTIIYSCLSLLLLIFHLWYFNLSYALDSELSMINALSIIEDYFNDNQETQDEFIIINTAYDNALVPFTDELGMSGNIPITDRSLLNSLFQKLDKIKDPQAFVVCDIDLSIPVQGDTSFFSSLIGKDNYVFPSPSHPLKRKGEFFETMPKFQPSRYSSYDGSIAKIELWNDKKEFSMAYHLFSNLNGKSSKTSQYFSHAGFFPRNIYLKYNLQEEDLHAKNKVLTLREAVNLLSLRNSDIAKSQFAGKIILIGNMKQDRHETFLGDMSGLVIIANCYLSLKNGLHIASWGWIVFSYFVIFILLIMAIRFEVFIKRNYNKRWVSLSITLLTYSLIAVFFSFISMLLFSG